MLLAEENDYHYVADRLDDLILLLFNYYYMTCYLSLFGDYSQTCKSEPGDALCEGELGYTVYDKVPNSLIKFILNRSENTLCKIFCHLNIFEPLRKLFDS